MIGSHDKRVDDKVLEAQVRRGLLEKVKRKKNRPVIKEIEVEMAFQEIEGILKRKRKVSTYLLRLCSRGAQEI